MPTSIGQVLVNEILPPKYQDYKRTLGAKELESMLAQIASEDPSIYKDVSARLMRLGNKAAYESGTTLRLSDILPPFDKSVVLKQLSAQEDKIRANPKLSDEQKTELVSNLYDKINDLIKEQTYDTSIAVQNPFAVQVKSKARGNKDQLAAMISTPGIYSDSRGKIVPMFIQHSYAEGLNPAEYWASSFGARLGTVSNKFATAQGGYLGKLLDQAAINEVVTEDDCGGAYGLPVHADDTDNIGAVLQRPVAGFDAGTVIDKDVLSELRKQKVDEIIIRSPTTCACKNGVCSKCCGIRETGGFPPLGYNLGINAASALSERIAQGALNCLVEGTLVRMADGSVKPIENVEPGEMVFGSDLRGHVRPTRVVARYDNGIQPCVRTKILPENGMWLEKLSGREFDDDRYIVLESTTIHKVLTTSSKLEEIGKLAVAAEKEKATGKICDSLVSVVSFWHSDAPEGKRPLSIFGVEETDGTSVTAHPVWSHEDIGMKHVYDLEVECEDHIYLLANGLVVHNTKHSGKKAKGKSRYSGFDAIKNMTTVPGTYKDAAVVAKEDGKVTEIDKAPQGGYYVYVGDQKQYVKPGYDLLVKEGDELEAGDQISDGVLNPADVVNYKGIGEGRRYFTDRFTQMMRDSNYAVNRRNVEAVARALVNHVQVDDEDAEAQMLPGDITTYSSWSFGYKPRPNTKYQSPKQAIGQYLESPVLHYTIGTKISRKTAKDLEKYGVTQIFSNPNPVAVTPVMRSVVKSTGDTDDWMARLGTTYLKTRLTEDAQHGAKSNLHSTNPLPGVAKGVEFGNYFEPGVKRTGGYTY